MRKVLFITLAVMLLVAGFSCRHPSGINPQNAGFAVLLQDRVFQLDTEEGLQFYIRSILGDQDLDIRAAALMEAKDDLGIFHVIKARYDQGDRTNSVLISLSLPETVSYTRDGLCILNNECTMICTTPIGCDGCSQELASRCKSQTCSCPDQAGCSTSVIFGEEVVVLR
jgi:hypothetical protein